MTAAIENQALSTQSFVVEAGEGRATPYDFFISHASADKEDFVDALVARAGDAGLDVFYDQSAIIWGDSIRQKIDDGLRRSYFGVVVLYPNFFERPWTQYELDGIVQCDLSGSGRLLPIWHRLTQDDVAKHAPSLAGRLALPTSSYSTDQIVEELLGSGLIDQSQKMTVAAMQMADMKVCAQRSQRVWARLRDWLGKQPIVNSARPRSPVTIENSVLQLAAAMRWARQVPAFSPIPLPEVTRSPSYRADVATLSAMFRYALGTPRRAGLLAFLRISVATWCRPDAALDASTTPRRGQFLVDQVAFALNPVGRRQTRKYRATVPLSAPVVEWLAGIDGPVVAGGLSKATWRRMAEKLGLPAEGQSGTKLIRRSVAHYCRAVNGERDQVQGEAMPGHRKPSTSDIYALPDPAHLGIALGSTEQLIGAIEALAPGAFYGTFTAQDDKVVAIGSRNHG